MSESLETQDLVCQQHEQQTLPPIMWVFCIMLDLLLEHRRRPQRVVRRHEGLRVQERSSEKMANIAHSG